ncbi:hypothetical protein M9435_004663 [Picochlorum sp. BPE23]|nr:hypothetical protein M9435_004663 [Picochlorum sp. BPE23]
MNEDVLSSPLLVFYSQLHDAIRRELSGLFKTALSLEKESMRQDRRVSAVDSGLKALKERYKFLEELYKYHSSIEDEVLYPALDDKVRNVTLAYSVEHEDEEHLLEELSSILTSENALKGFREDGGVDGHSDGSGHTSEGLHKLARKVEEVHTTLTKHLEKEGEQILPLLQNNFSINEQAGLAVQFLCCIPYSAVKPMLQWLLGSLSKEDMRKLSNQMAQAISDPWLKKVIHNCLEPREVAGELKEEHAGEESPQRVVGEPNEFVCCGCSPCTTVVEGDIENSAHHPLKEVVYFHEAIRSAIKSFAKEAALLNNNPAAAGVSLEQLQGLAERHRFIRAVCHFHSTSEDEILFPALNRSASPGGEISHQCEEDHSLETARFEALGRLLGDARACARRGAKEVSELIGELAEVAQKLSKSMHVHMAREESDIFPALMARLCPAEQRYIVWRLVQAMPLRLLERFMPWIASQISKTDLDMWLSDMRKASQTEQKPLVELLRQWALRSITGQELANEMTENPAAYPIKTCGPSERHPSDRDSMPESFRHPKRIKTGSKVHHVSRQKLDIDSPIDENEEPVILINPIDHIFQFHKALKQELKDLEKAALHLQQEATAAESWTSDSILCSMIPDLQTRFEFLRGIYRAHSRAEDEIVFPALESKETLSNVSHAYSLDHKQEEHLFQQVSSDVAAVGACMETFNLEILWSAASKLSRMCAAIRASLETHIRAEEKELWPLFTEHFTVQEQEELVGIIIGQTGAEVLQVMLSWVTKSMTEEEANAMMFSLKSASKSTAFANWLGAAQANASNGFTSNSNGNDVGHSSSPVIAMQEQKAVLEEVAAYLAKNNISGANAAPLHQNILVEPTSLDATPFKPGWEDIFRMNQKQLESAVRRVSADDSLEPQRKAYLIQHLMASRYIVAQQKRNPVLLKAKEHGMPSVTTVRPHDTHRGSQQAATSPLANSSTPSECTKMYHDKEKGILGCKHYARNAMLVAPCCDKEFTCRLCHDEKVLDHKLDRYQVKEMRCMLCGLRQNISNACSGCGSTMAAYYCNICHLFDNDGTKDIYHCPFCNFCRRGKGLGIDSFHCMSCNACMSLELFNKHKCTEAALSGTCPVCSDPLFESNTPIKELPCGHFMHSLCFGAYVRYSYTCPICSKSLGDMEVYWKMIDAMLASEKLPYEYAKRKQTVRCNDCGAISQAPFHFVYHKCSSCHGYNTRVCHSEHE